MTDFLTRRGGIWHFVRRVPLEYAALDPRGIVRHSTRVKIADDRTGRRAARVALTLNEELEAYWVGLTRGQTVGGLGRYDEARRRARSLGFDYVPNDNLLALTAEKRLERLETLVTKGLVNDSGARKALLGTVAPEGFNLSRLFDEYEAIARHEIKDLSPDQHRIWGNSRKRAVAQFVDVIGDKPVTEISGDDGLTYVEWWRDRVIDEDISVKTANKDIGQLSRMLKELSVRRRLNLPELFKGLYLRGEQDNPRPPFENDFIRAKFLSGAALAGLNENARLVVYVMIETGLRPSEIVNLRETTICLGAPIPYIRVKADGRRLKTRQSDRELPLVGVALRALQLRPAGFPTYRDRASGLSATVNKYLLENDLRPTTKHTLYSLRHSFKDRLIAAEAPDSLIDNLMGHKTYKPKYGKGPPLELKLKYLAQIAFATPNRL
jgi:integrase